MLPTTIFVHKIKLCVNGLYFILLNAGNTIWDRAPSIMSIVAAIPNLPGHVNLLIFML